MLSFTFICMLPFLSSQNNVYGESPYSVAPDVQMSFTGAALLLTIDFDINLGPISPSNVTDLSFNLDLNTYFKGTRWHNINLAEFDLVNGNNGIEVIPLTGSKMKISITDVTGYLNSCNSSNGCNKIYLAKTIIQELIEIGSWVFSLTELCIKYTSEISALKIIVVDSRYPIFDYNTHVKIGKGGSGDCYIEDLVGTYSFDMNLSQRVFDINEVAHGALGSNVNDKDLNDPTRISDESCYCSETNALYGDCGQLSFDGNDQVKIEFNSQQEIFSNNNFTFEAFIEADINQSFKPTIISNLIPNPTTGPSHLGYWFGLNPSGKLAFRIKNQTYIANDRDLRDGLCHHVAVTRSGGSILFYIDGVLFDNGYTTPQTLRNLNNVGPRIGYSIGVPNSTFRGKIDEVNIWKRALAQGEIDTFIAMRTASQGTKNAKNDTGEDALVQSKLIEGIYPNPASQLLWLHVKDYTNARVEIIDLEGSVIKEINLKSDRERIDVSSLSTGMYIVRITTDEHYEVQKISILH